MEEFRASLEAESLAAARRANVERSRLAVLSDTRPAVCDPHLQAVLARSAALLHLKSRSMASGAGHDTAFISQVAPAAMVFVPCKDGRSHTPEEWTTPEALAAGTEVLLESILAVDAEA